MVVEERKKGWWQFRRDTVAEMSAPHVPEYGESIPEVDESGRGTEIAGGGHGGEEKE